MDGIDGYKTDQTADWLVASLALNICTWVYEPKEDGFLDAHDQLIELQLHAM
jgi:hypothetical protein